MGRVREAAIRHPSVPHQHAREVGAEHRRRVGEPAAGADGVDRRLRGGERPQPVAGRGHAPAGLVGRDHRAAADLLAQRRIRGRRRVGRAVQQSDQAAPGHVQSEPGPQHAGGLLQRQARLGVQFGGQRGDVRPPLHAGRAERIGGLQGVPALHAPPALRVAAHLDVEAAHQGAHVRHVFLILRRHPLHGDVAAAVGARLRGGRRMGLVHPGRRPAASLLPVLRAGAPPRAASGSLPAVFGEGGRLPASGAPRSLEFLLQMLDAALQILAVALQVLAAALPVVPILDQRRLFSFEMFDAHVPGVPPRPRPHRTAPVIAPARHTSRIGTWW